MGRRIFATHEEKLEYLRNAPDGERWCWLAGELNEGEDRISALEDWRTKVPCQRWHGAVLKWIVGGLGGGCVLAICYALLERLLK